MILRERPWANLEALHSRSCVQSFMAVMKLIFQRRPKVFVSLFPLFYGDCSVCVHR